MSSDTQHSDKRRDATMTRIIQPTHDRLKDHCREGETLSGCMARALDALDREQELPDAVREALEDRDA